MSWIPSWHQSPKVKCLLHPQVLNMRADYVSVDVDFNPRFEVEFEILEQLMQKFNLGDIPKGNCYATDYLKDYGPEEITGWKNPYYVSIRNPGELKIELWLRQRWAAMTAHEKFQEEMNGRKVFAIQE